MLPAIPTWETAKLAVAPYLMWIKLAIIAAVVLTLYSCGFKAGSAATEAKWQSAAKDQAAAFQRTLTDSIATERRVAQTNQETSRELQTQIIRIQAERDRLRSLPARVVRVYVPAAGPAGVPAAAGADGRRDGAASAPAQLPGPLGPDIGRSLYTIVDDSDAREAELAARLVACQEAYRTAVDSTRPQEGAHDR